MIGLLMEGDFDLLLLAWRWMTNSLNLRSAVNTTNYWARWLQIVLGEYLKMQIVVGDLKNVAFRRSSFSAFYIIQ